MPFVFFLTKLQPGAEPEAYERFVRERDYPRARAFPHISAFEVYRLKGTLGGEPLPYDYAEVVEVSDLEGYQQDREGAPDKTEFRKELHSYITSVFATWGERVE